MSHQLSFRTTIKYALARYSGCGIPLISSSNSGFLSSYGNARRVTPWDDPSKKYVTTLFKESTKKRSFFPQRIPTKVTTVTDAVALVHDGDTVCVSGFVTQGAAEAVLRALGERFKQTSSPNNLTLLFGGGPGDYGERGLSHLAQKKGDVSMLRRTIGSHYGQVPKVAELVINEQVEAWTLPMGSISRMIRAQSTNSPGHVTPVGLDTYVDPDQSGGAANQRALKSTLHPKLVSKLTLMDGTVNLLYKALPINVAIIRGTTADPQGNISMEHESLLCDQRITAAAAKNSGGIVIAQVKRLVESGTIPMRSVVVPAPLVDCVVVVDEKDHQSLHGMSYEEFYNPAMTGEIKTPLGKLPVLDLDIRKVIARRAFFVLKPNLLVNLGIGLPEGVASVAAEEGMLPFVTLSTEAGVFGGIPASAKMFGPAYNPTSQIELNSQFDLYDGGLLDMCFLGAAQISKTGDVNVSRLSKNRLTGPGGFIDISQSTGNICFMTTFTTKGLDVALRDGKITVQEEGKTKKFVNQVFEKTFSGEEAVRRGQKVLYVTERAVFRRTAKNDTLELIEIAPGIDLQKDVLDQMEFTPIISENMKEMDPRIFSNPKMEALTEFFGSLQDRCIYNEEDHAMYLDLFGVTLDTKHDIEVFAQEFRNILRPLVASKGPINIVVNYDGFDLRDGLEEIYEKTVHELQKELYRSAKRYSGGAFRRAILGKGLHLDEWDADVLFDELDVQKHGYLTVEELRFGLASKFMIQLNPGQITKFLRHVGDTTIDRHLFASGLQDVLASLDIK